MEQNLAQSDRSASAPENRKEQARRKQHAFLAGDQARDQNIISPEAHMLYEYLLRYTSCRSFCWPGQAHLAEILKCSVSTIKRRTKELIDAGLIQRERRLNRSSLTFIAAYGAEMLDYQAEHEALACSDDQKEQHDETLDAMTPAQRRRGPVTPPAFFAPQSGPTVGSVVSPLTIKSQNPEDLGGGKDTETDDSTDNETIHALQDAGVVDHNSLSELRDRPIEQVARTVSYVAKCRRGDDPRRPGLIVHLLRKGFGRHHCETLDGSSRKLRPHHDRSGSRTPALASDDPRRYLSQGFCQHGMLGMCPQCETSASTNTLVEDACETVAQENITQPLNAEVITHWPTILARLAQQVTPDELSTWLGQTTLLDIMDNCAFIGTPNVFVRNHVRDAYTSQMSAALAAELGRPVQVEVVIDTSVLA